MRLTFAILLTLFSSLVYSQERKLIPIDSQDSLVKARVLYTRQDNDTLHIALKRLDNNQRVFSKCCCDSVYRKGEIILINKYLLKKQ